MKIPVLKNANMVMPDDWRKNGSPEPQCVPEEEVQYVGSGEKLSAREVVESMLAIMQKFEGHVPETSDGMASIALHKVLRLSRRQASLPEFWHYLTICVIPQYVSWRWMDTHKQTLNVQRYLGPWRRNALGRLWWWAECSRDTSEKNPYFYTDICSASQEFMLHSVDDLLGGESAILLPLCKLFVEKQDMMNRNVVRAIFNRLNAWLGTTNALSLGNERMYLELARILDHAIRDEG